MNPGLFAEIDPRLLESWCRRELQAGPARRLFAGGHLAAVFGLELDDARKVVIKLHADSDRLHAIVGVQRALFDAGYPCPEPLAGPSALDGRVATAETYVKSRAFEGISPPPAPCAQLLAQFVQKAPDSSLFPALAQAPPWVGWDHAASNTWPTPDDLNVDLNSIPGPGWLDESADRIRLQLCGDDAHSIATSPVAARSLATSRFRSCRARPEIEDWDCVGAERASFSTNSLHATRRAARTAWTQTHGVDGVD